MRIFRGFLTGFMMALAGATPLAAQGSDEDEARTLFGGDRFIAGSDVAADQETEGDLFIAGERVAVAASVAGSAHMAGRRLTVSAPVQGNLYAAGYSLRLVAPVGGAVTATGAELTLSAPIGGNLRASGWDVRLEGPVSGAALLAGDTVSLNAGVEGDVAISASTLEFGQEARVTGQLTIYSDDPDSISVPGFVAPEGRVVIRESRDFAAHDGAEWGMTTERSLGAQIAGFLLKVIIVAALALGLAALMPDRVSEWRARCAEHPGQSLWSGFLGISTLVGAGVVACITLIGIVLLPAAVLLAGIAMALGYVFSTFALGAVLWRSLGQSDPATLAARGGVALIGALVAALVGLIPFLGWLFVLALGFAGFGAALRTWRHRRQVAY
ncbi:hypothetical protein [Nioella nitratireducens]|uniref:hypothetical protein n=1 Tax=Nioella nitratireducens TaxID=1287720 RepID=UPI0009FF70B6|nr:hypothetical protein [Nioella nitratireducens]